MKTRITLILAAFFFSFNTGFAQQDEECMLNLTLMNDFYKSKKMDEAYEPFMAVRNKCPKFNYAIYAYGEKILMHKADNATGEQKKAFLNDVMKLWDEGLENFPSKYTIGGVLQSKAQLMYDSKADLGLNDKQVYDAFDNLYKTDLENFTNPKSLYTYFSLLVDLHAAGKAEIQAVFDKYDDVSDKISTEVENFTNKVNALVEKEEAGTTLTDKEEKAKSSYNSYLAAYDQVSGSIDSKLGALANCENLIPLYNKDFENFKNDAVWLKRAVSRMYNKECTDDPLYIKLVKAYDEVDPSAITKVFVAGILLKDGKENEAMTYFNQAYDLETDKLKKANLAYKIADNIRKKGNYGQARSYYQKALANSPSMGKAHIAIAGMYAASANNCGDSNFNKRAVFWLAAAEARKAGRVDANLKSYAEGVAANYDAKAPTKSEIFTAGNAGQTISIGCWIGASVTVPKL
jgi:tetratricopeptide (TPR) repeat protein